MSDGASQRQFRRYQVQLPLLHTPSSSRANKVWAGWTRDLSEGGVCVELDQSLPAPTRLQVCLQTDRGVIDMEAEVVWAGAAPPGSQGGILHGLAFTRLAPDQLQSLQYLLLSWGLGRRVGVRIPFEVAITCQHKGGPGPLISGHGRNGSRNGLLLRLPQVVPPGTTLELTLHTHQGPLTVEGTIVWVAPPEGRSPGGPIRHGFRLIALGWPTALALGLALAGPLKKNSWLAPREGSA